VFAQKTVLRLPAISSLVAMLATALVVSVVAAAVSEPAKTSAAAKAADLAAAAEDLVKSLETTVSNATSFKQGEEEVERKGYVIALLANGVSESEGDAKWKARALAVRDAALGLAKSKGQPAADKALKDIKALFGGGDAGKGEAKKYLDVSELKYVMKEVNERNKPMTKNLRGTNFARSKESIARDAQVWALLAAVARADTKSAQQAKKPQADFERYSDEFFTGAKSLAAAAGKGDQNAASDALKAIRKACADCHAVFRPDIE